MRGEPRGRKVLEMGEAIAKEGLNVATLSGKALKEPQRLGSSPFEMKQWHFVARCVTVKYTSVRESHLLGQFTPAFRRAWRRYGCARTRSGGGGAQRTQLIELTAQRAKNASPRYSIISACKDLELSEGSRLITRPIVLKSVVGGGAARPGIFVTFRV